MAHSNEKSNIIYMYKQFLAANKNNIRLLFVSDWLRLPLFAQYRNIEKVAHSEVMK